jgi:hypothetical protein
MTEPRPEEDVQIPLRVQAVVARQEGWRGRSVNLVAVGLVAFVAVGIVLGTVNVGGPQRLPPLVLSTQEPTASPRAAATSRPSIGPIRTSPPLPEHLVLGDELPTERHLVFANGIQAMDMATGSPSVGVRGRRRDLTWQRRGMRVFPPRRRILWRRTRTRIAGRRLRR